MQLMQQRKQPTARAILTLAAVMSMSVAGPVTAQRGTDPRHKEFPIAAEPLMAVVSLNKQRVSIYAGGNKVLQAPVSTGQKGYETPAGIYSVIEKNREHYSNLYDDAAMPFMQRLTWSGIALHAGALPGYPASHGCIRMPHEFAEQLFDLSKMGMRVVVVRDDMSPVDFAHPALFKPGPIRSEGSIAPVADRPSNDMASSATGGAGAGQTWRSIAASKAAAAATAAARSDAAARTSSRARSEAAPFFKKIRIAEGAKLRAESLVREAERTLESAGSPQAKQIAEEQRASALERLAAAQNDLAAVSAEGQAKIDAATAARDEAKAAETAKAAAYDEAKAAEAKLAPVSVFISRKTQRLYVRQAFQPVFESPVTIADAEVPIGTSIFTAVAYANGEGDLRWTAFSMYDAPGVADHGPTRRHTQRNGGPTRTDVDTAKHALERISIPQDAIDRINEIISPRSSLIISDEALSRETGKGTDFIVLMSGEPQGGIKMRRRSPDSSSSRYRPFFPPRSYGNGASPLLWW